MKQWIEDNVLVWISKTSLIFTLVILGYSFIGISFDARGIRVIFLASVLIAYSEYLIFGIRGLNRKCKWILHYIWCFIGYGLVMTIGEVTYPMRQWSPLTWLASIVGYTIMYIGLSWFYKLQRNREIEKLNKQLVVFKSKYREE